MAETPHTESQAEQTSEQAKSLPSKALYMDWECAVHRRNALFAAIGELAGSGLYERDNFIINLASLGKSIVEDQLDAEK